MHHDALPLCCGMRAKRLVIVDVVRSDLQRSTFTHPVDFGSVNWQKKKFEGNFL